MPAINHRPIGVVLLTALMCVGITNQFVAAQTYSVIYSFAGGTLGEAPYSGLTMDRAGNLYGTTFAGGTGSCAPDGAPGCGTVYKLTQRNSHWTFGQLYSFAGGSDGALPYLSRVVLGPNGSLYGTTLAGGTSGCNEQFSTPGCGTVFNLQPPATVCKSVSCPWRETQLYQFQGVANGGSDGASPDSEVVFDQAGTMYGVTLQGGSLFGGAAYKLAPKGGGWMESIIANFGGNLTTPLGTMKFDSSGDLYGTSYNESGTGGVWELTPSMSDWLQTTLYSFQNQLDGEWSGTGVIFDHAGNLYGASNTGGSGGGGVVFQLTPSSDSWQFIGLESLAGAFACGPYAALAMDGAGNLYGTTGCGGTNGFGNVFELSPPSSDSGQWIYIDLYDFRGGSDGAYPFSNLVLDASGNLYGTASAGGSVNSDCPSGCGVVFTITP
jgi:uncharacterized repeat protein (TIGR03803 family)